MGLFGSYLGALMGGTRKPSVPALAPLDLATEQSKAAEANIGITPDATKLSNLTADQIQQLIERTFPGFGATADTISKNISEEAQGKIPTDVISEIKRDTAASSLVGGYGGSPMQYNKEARNLGLTSFDIMNRGLASAESWLAASERMMQPAENVFTGMFVTPGQQASFDVSERDSQWNVQWLKNQISAMPDPERLALGEFLGGIGDAAASMVGGGAVAGQNTSETYPSGGFGSGAGWGGGAGAAMGAGAGSDFGAGAWSGGAEGASAGASGGGGGGL